MNPPFEWTDEQVTTALHVAPHEDCSLIFTGISTDSRTTREGNLFVAVCGDNFDGHDYVSDALGRGAQGAVVARWRWDNSPYIAGGASTPLWSASPDHQERPGPRS